MCAADNAGPGARFDRQQWRQDNLRFATGRSMDHYQISEPMNALLAAGATLDEACGQLHISRNTGKSHLSAVFSKTGVTRQTRLVQLILGSVAPMGD